MGTFGEPRIVIYERLRSIAIQAVQGQDTEIGLFKLIELLNDIGDDQAVAMEAAEQLLDESDEEN